MNVSNLFVEAFLNINVSDQSENLKKLSERELLLLIILTCEKFNEPATTKESTPELDNYVINNLKPYEDYIISIYKYYNDGVDEYNISELDNIVDSESIFDESNNPIPKSLTPTEATIKRREDTINGLDI